VAKILARRAVARQKRVAGCFVEKVVYEKVIGITRTYDVPRKKRPLNSLKAHRIDREGLDWAITTIREWRRRVNNRTDIKYEWIGKQIIRLAECGVQESLLGFVILGCEWMFRLRRLQPGDAKMILARIEGGLRPVLHDDAWLVTEALGSSIRKLMTTQRVLAAQWEDMPRKIFVPTSPESLPAQHNNVVYIAPLRARPGPLIRARPGPAPKLVPWIAGVIAERLMAKQRGEGYQLTSSEHESVVEFVSALCDRDIEKQEYVVRRSRLLQDQELDSLVERFKSSHDLLVSWDKQTTSPDRPEWFRIVRTRLEGFGPWDTFPNDLSTVSKLVDAYGTSPPRTRVSSARTPVSKSSRFRSPRSR